MCSSDLEPAALDAAERELAGTAPAAVVVTEWTEQVATAPDDERFPALTAGLAHGVDPLPVSFAQLRILIEPDPAHPVFNIPFAFVLDGELDERALRSSLDAILERHEGWRTGFGRNDDGSWYQFVRPFDGFDLDVVDLSRLPESQRAAEASRLASAIAQERLELAGPLVRGLLLRMGPRRHALAFSVHHLISDGWSTNLWCAEFSELYTAARLGRSPALRDLPVHYPDYSVWQRSWLSGERLEQELALGGRVVDDEDFLDRHEIGRAHV